MAAFPNPLNSTVRGYQGQAVTGLVWFSLWFFSCMLDYLFSAVPSLRLLFQAAVALVFTLQKTAKRAAAEVPGASVAWEEEQPWVQESCFLGEFALLSQLSSLALNQPLPGWGASTRLSQRTFPFKLRGSPSLIGLGNTLPVISILHLIPVTILRHKKELQLDENVEQAEGPYLSTDVILPK